MNTFDQDARTSLEDRRRSLTRQTREVQAEEQELAGAAPSNWSDRARHREDETVLRGLSESERQELIHIQDALDRLDRGGYGICADCGKSISRKRLRAMPEARRCTDCQASSETDS